jgi:NTP pyrophosphatase (non-canonical NTP hydrolase)
MNFNEYQSIATETVEYPEAGNNIVYPALGLAGEAGEVAEKVKKLWRNAGMMSSVGFSIAGHIDMVKELGDVLWYLAACATEMNVTLDEIAELNLLKLKDRKQRNVIKSEGDNR